MHTRTLVASAALCAGAAHASAATIVNGGFETGDFTGWVTTDSPDPFDAIGVAAGGTITEFDGFLGPNVVIPSEGGFAASHGFDGLPGVISISQDVGIVGAADVLTFDYRAGWDLITFITPGASDRSFDVVIEAAGGGGAVFGTFNQLIAAAGTDTSGGPNTDTGPLSGSVDLSVFAGTNIRVTFAWTVPDQFTGPANAQLDNVAIIPSPGAAGLAAVAGLAVIRRRR